jgi:hypothetical protein
MLMRGRVSSVSHDECPNCRRRFEILFVKFRLAGVQMISACPNCALINDVPEARFGVREVFKHLPFNRRYRLAPRPGERDLVPTFLGT